jgi:hypothetical protein
MYVITIPEIFYVLVRKKILLRIHSNCRFLKIINETSKERVNHF